MRRHKIGPVVFRGLKPTASGEQSLRDAEGRLVRETSGLAVSSRYATLKEG